MFCGSWQLPFAIGFAHGAFLHRSFALLPLQTKSVFRGKTFAILHRADFTSPFLQGISRFRSVQKCRSFAKSGVRHVAKPIWVRSRP